MDLSCCSRTRWLSTSRMSTGSSFASLYLLTPTITSAPESTRACFCAALSSVLYLGSLEHAEVSKLAFFIYLMPVFASVFAWAIRGEGVEPWTAVCGGVIVMGIAIATRKAG